MMNNIQLLRAIHHPEAFEDEDTRRKYALKVLSHQPPYPESLRKYAQQIIGEQEAQHTTTFLPENKIDVSQEEIDRLFASPLFNDEWYQSNYLQQAQEHGLERDVNRLDVLLHFCRAGWKSGYNPSPEFNTRFYLEQYPDVRKTGINPLLHYILQGKKEGRMACPIPTVEHCDLQREVDKEYIAKITKRRGFFDSDSYRTVAFYLPQYHTIPENDKWWGEGFTEWTNVRPAEPLFDGHYQPHQPSELGYYSLTNEEILKRQTVLAKSYGVDAFCFYFYWFNGKTLLEKPLEIFLNNTSIDHQFCLCWANENWTRRWDGKENDILIAQNYSQSDDLSFIKYIAKYLCDPRYLRIEGKPVLLLYRPSLIPDPPATTNIWRQWCRENGLGELHIVYTQSFECSHPTAYGCDAGVEFSPNIPIGHQGVTPTMITDKIEGLHPEFCGKIFDWNGYVQRSEHLPHPGYPIYRCVNPGWDNTPRKKLNSTIFVNSCPRNFQKWTLNAIGDTCFAHGNAGLLFVNAWNEWAEGAHLEPDQQYGYSYLESLRMARVRHKVMEACRSPKQKEFPEVSEIAIIIHAFYPEILEEIVNDWEKVEYLQGCWFIITSPPGKAEECKHVLEQLQPNCRWLVIATNNHGRDILPFFKIYDLILRLQIKVYLKLHTKRSKHREDGDEWRRTLYQGLLDPEKCRRVIDALYGDTGIGIVLPKEHILPMTDFFGSNCERVYRLTSRLGTPICRLNELPLAAGSMFWARPEALIPMHMLHCEEDFEPERGQVDGTYAHAMERMFSISAASVDLMVTDTDLEPFRPEDFTEYDFASKG